MRKLSVLAPTDRLIGINHARPYWLRDRCSISAASFLVEVPVDPFFNKFQLWRHGGRMHMANSDIPSSTQNPVLLDKGHPLMALIILYTTKNIFQIVIFLIILLIVRVTSLHEVLDAPGYYERVVRAERKSALQGSGLVRIVGPCAQRIVALMPRAIASYS